MTLIDPQGHLTECARTATGRRAPNDGEPQPPDDLRDQLTIAMIADQDVHLRPRPVISREEHDLVEERIDVSLSGEFGRFWCHLRIVVTEVVFQGAAQVAHKDSAGGTDSLDQQGMLDLHTGALSFRGSARLSTVGLSYTFLRVVSTQIEDKVRIPALGLMVRETPQD
jgi:hypothetical protein